MEYSACHVIYLDRRAQEERFEESMLHRRPDTSSRQIPTDSLAQSDLDVQDNVKALLSCFHGVHIVKSGAECFNRIRALDSSAASSTPIMVFTDVALDPKEEASSRSSFRLSQMSAPKPASPKIPQHQSGDRSGSSSDNYYGLSFLSHVASEIKQTHISRLVVLIALVRVSVGSPLSTQTETVLVARPATDTSRILKCLEAGATDVIVGPLSHDRVTGLTIHAYRAYVEGSKQKPAFLAEKRVRKMSWVGVEEERPYAWLRETMVSSLMDSICKPETALVKPVSDLSYAVDADREEMIERAIASWNFATHDFSDDELMHAGFLMLKHALQMPELTQWRLPDLDLKNFLQACREAYNSFVLYHNFRHVIDVLQAVFYFLLQLGVLPRHKHHLTPPNEADKPSPIAALLRPFEAFVLLVAAIGHDVGHPGVNNAFLVALRAPLAQLYNDNSVLEAFHCAAYSQILRRYWNSAYLDTEVRRLLIKVILATDMQLHFKYMSDLGNLQDKLGHSKGTDGWAPQQLEEHKFLACGLLIKCADISNVARPFSIASKWADILQREFARQGEMEQRVQIPTTLFGGPPDLNDITKLAQSQVGFMNIFAFPLFDSVADILPPMRFAGDQIKSNQDVWKEKMARIEEEKKTAKGEWYESDGFRSPRSGSPDRMTAAWSPQTSHPEGLPASGSSPEVLELKPLSTSVDSPHIEHDTLGRSGVGEAVTTPDRSAKAFSQSSSGLGLAPSNSEGEDASRRSSGVIPTGNVAKGPSLGAIGPVPGRENIPPNFSTTVFTDKAPASSRTSQATSNSGTGVIDHGPVTPQKSGFDAEPGQSPAPFYGNFSRPISARHSTQPSYARSSAPSGAPTFASNAMPTSPTETQATSFLTEGSDTGPDPSESGLNHRPRSSYSSGLNTSTIGSSGHSPMNRGKSPTSIPRSSGPEGANGYTEPERTVRKKNSRFRLKFWKQTKRPGEATP